MRSARMEGVHLRGAKVARGGIRWSDRLDDFRTEVLGLVRTQMVKNAVIVPAGSKGSFVTLRQVAPQDVAEEAKEQYRTLIRGLLDLTDNLDLQGAPLPPADVICFDDPDPYLVVAADKGTARYSDVANAVAAEYEFWLGDAFASGGSHGYDHKKVRITACGAWESVRRHFRERHKDIQSEPFTVVGIGDMSGDVFGNGMLLSRKTRLVAAFDDRHVFIDPRPDEDASFRERERLFHLGRSSWNDYDRACLSPDGLVVSREAKEVRLSDEARRVLGLPAEGAPLDGESLVRAVLCAPVELIWNGGIGTYVKASTETHADAGDPPNDAVRVNATELRCGVVGEGGNLGFTQLARIEYALAGGRINTDALDNSGGVDLSDREVNLKILLDGPVRAEEMSQERRNELLVEFTSAEAGLVMQDSRSQSRAVSLDEIRAASGESTEGFRDLMSSLEKAGMLDRASESLPTLEALQERQEEGGSLTRPELCVLLAYAKLSLISEISRSSLPDDPATESYLLGYFPPLALVEAGQDALHHHKLGREIIASQMTNDLVDLMGATFVHRMVRSTGKPAHVVVRAWLVAARLAGHRSLLKQMATQVSPTDVQAAYRWLLGLGGVLERTARWILQNVPPEVPTAQTIGEKLEGLAVLRQHFADLVRGDDRTVFERLVGEIREFGAAEGFAQSLISLRFLDQLLEILGVASETAASPLDTARAFYRVSDVLRVPWLRQSIFQAARDDRWGQRAAQALADDLTRAHHRVLVEVMRRWRNDGDIDEMAERVISSCSREVERFRLLLEEIQQEPAITLSGMSVEVREMTALSQHLNGELS